MRAPPGPTRTCTSGTKRARTDSLSLRSAKFWMAGADRPAQPRRARRVLRRLRRIEGPPGLRRRGLAGHHRAGVIHLIRGSFRYVSRKYSDELARDLRPIYTAVNEPAAAAALDDLDTTWGARYPAMIRLWRNAWSKSIPFLECDGQTRWATRWIRH